uniref:Uncharacterized protein n=1 Tax=Phasianus colchicus TaxID=9054 RepID=A0A669Q991_PHACC
MALKIVFVGNSGVGKSSFIHRFCYDRFLADLNATIGVVLVFFSVTLAQTFSSS